LRHIVLPFSLHPNARSRIHKDIGDINRKIGEQYPDDDKKETPLEQEVIMILNRLKNQVTDSGV
jgi:hypothetical protein